jgi:SAM-dependent methyltransferase
VVEHFGIHQIGRVLDEILRVLKPGGLLILETPNAHNVFVGSHDFYLDPTHVRPRPSELLRFVLQMKGFSGIDVVPLRGEDKPPLSGKDGDAASFINEHFFGPRDYAVFATRI